MRPFITLMACVLPFLSCYRALAYDIREPSRPGSQVEWFQDHDAQKEYDKYREALKKDKRDKTKDILKYLTTDEKKEKQGRQKKSL
ncbi:MAG: hypothetical protein HQM16_07925 [Deltaproteobacteria bacterium]|nr:hypothetical protein [Deltaproteobacteria bacterium]